MQSRNDIGFGKKIRATWLKQALEFVAQQTTFEDAKAVLSKEIAAENEGSEAIRKILTSLKRVWFTPPEYCQLLHHDAVNLFQKSPSNHLASLLCWGMSVAAYPFVGAVAESLGRLFKLQEVATRRDVERRIREQFGDRDFVARITRYNVSSFLDWGIIKETKVAGVYIPGRKLTVSNSAEWAWLSEAILISTGKDQINIAEFRASPMLFPTLVDEFTTAAVKKHPRLQIVRQSLRDEVLVLGESSSAL